MKVFFSVGEPSGDLHAANLIAQLRARRPDFEFVGLGGPRMSQAGCELLADMTQLAVMWLLNALLRLPRFLALLGEADRYFRDHRPAAVVLIDFPGFNWWIARRAKARRIPVFYYGVPQVWAWAPWRVQKLKRLTDHVLCKLPFETDWFGQRGCNAHFVGHPYFDELATRPLDRELIEQLEQASPRLVTLLPGSRTQEIAANLPMMLAAAREVVEACPEVTLAIASYNEPQAKIAASMVQDAALAVKIHAGRTGELIAAADACIACSGSVSLELLYHQKPAIIVYRISRFAYWLQARFRLVKYITLVNLLACNNIDRKDPTTEDVPFPEYLTCSDDHSQIAEDVVRLVNHPRYHEQVVAQLHKIKHLHAKPGASERAAVYIDNHVQPVRQPDIRPHFRPSLPSTQISST